MASRVHLRRRNRKPTATDWRTRWQPPRRISRQRRTPRAADRGKYARLTAINAMPGVSGIAAGGGSGGVTMKLKTSAASERDIVTLADLAPRHRVTGGSERRVFGADALMNGT